MPVFKFRRLLPFLGFWALWWLASSGIDSVSAWEWIDLVAGGRGGTVSFLSYEQVAELRVRDIKRLLARKHGYSADEIGRMLDKKELIGALAFEEDKIRIKEEDDMKRYLLKFGIIAALVAVAVVVLWPLIAHAYEVVCINFVVYTDRKRHELTRCSELQSAAGTVGVVVMLIIDVLQVWLTVSVILSWVMRSKYFFPVPSLSIRPAQLLGASPDQALSSYGINVGSMIITWVLRFLSRRVEAWTGRVLSRAYQSNRQRENRSASTRKKTKPKDSSESLNERRTIPVSNSSILPESSSSTLSITAPEREPGPFTPSYDSSAHREFLEQIENHASELDGLD